MTTSYRTALELSQEIYDRMFKGTGSVRYQDFRYWAARLADDGCYLGFDRDGYFIGNGGGEPSYLSYKALKEWIELANQPVEVKEDYSEITWEDLQGWINL